MIILDLGYRSIGIRDYRPYAEPSPGVMVSNSEFLVYTDGLLMSGHGDYILSDNDTITFASPPSEGSLVSVVRFREDGRFIRRTDVVADGRGQTWIL